MGITQLLQPSETTIEAADNFEVQIEVMNFGDEAIDSFYVDFWVNGEYQLTYDYITPTLAGGETYPLIIGTHDFLPDETYDLQIILRLTDGEIDANNSNDTLEVTITTLPEDLVFPGDVNYDQIANNEDLLDLGVVYGTTGVARNGASTDWVGQSVEDWTTTQFNGENAKHADCNGDGIVNADDVEAIRLNYNQTHESGKTEVESNLEGNLILELPEEVAEGQTVSLKVLLGELDNPVENFYGVAFTLQYDPTFIKEESFLFDYSENWLGTLESDLLTIEKVFHSDGQIDIGMVRTDQMDISGGGEIMSIDFAMSDAIIGKTEGVPFNINIIKIKAIDEMAVPINMQVQQAQSTVILGTHIPLLAHNATDVEIIPQVNQQQIIVEGNGIQNCQLFSLQGRLIATEAKESTQQLLLNTHELIPGIYILRLRTTDGIYAHKLYWQ